MKMRIRKVPVLLVLFAVTGILAGCFGGTRKDAEKILNTMQEKMGSLSDGGFDWRLDLEGGGNTADWGEIGLLVKATGTTQADPVTGQSVTDATVYRESMGEEETMDVEAYTEAEEGQLHLWLLLRDRWVSLQLDGTQEGLFPDWDAWESAFQLAKDPVTRDNIPCYSFQAELGPEKAEELLGNWQALLGYSGMDILQGRTLHVGMYVEQEDMTLREISFGFGGDAAQPAGETGSTEEEAAEASAEPFRLTSFRLAFRFSGTALGKAEVPGEAKEHAEPVSDAKELAKLWYGEGLAEEEFLGGRISMLEHIKNPVVIREFSPEEEAGLMWDREQIQIRLRRVYTNGKSAAYADFEVTNGMDKDIVLYPNGAALNYVMTEYGIDLSVKAGETETLCMYFPDLENMEEDPFLLTARFSASYLYNYERIFDTGRLDVALAENVPEPEVRQGGTVVFENSLIEVTAYPADTSDEHFTIIPLAVKNLSERDLSVYSGEVTISGKPVDVYAYGQAFSGTMFYSSLTIRSADLKQAELEEVKDVRFTLEIQDMKTYNHMQTTEEIAIP